MPESIQNDAVAESRSALERLLDGHSLERGAVSRLFGRLMDGELGESMMAALLIALRVKGESVPEIAGAAEAMRGRVVPIPHSRDDLVDTCGTGGDGKGTFNVSTAAALAAAGAGVPIAKHGNRSVSSKSGSADVLAALGVPIELPPQTLARALDEHGIAFLFAPKLHPAMGAVMPVRRALGIRTIFNLLGPLTNPAGARRQVVGVYSDHLVEPVAQVLGELGSEHALVVHGSDGLDEITTTGATRVAEWRDGRVEVHEITPDRYGLPFASAADLAGGTPEENAWQLETVVGGASGPLADITVLNAAAAIYVSGRVDSLAEGVGAARGALESGAAQEVLATLRSLAEEFADSEDRQ